jgi:hypothetical protein
MADGYLIYLHAPLLKRFMHECAHLYPEKKIKQKAGYTAVVIPVPIEDLDDMKIIARVERLDGYE